jgi:hypothetical protein
MLWTAGQERQEEERRLRRADLFTAARDATLDVGVSTGQLKSHGGWRQPSYLRGDRASQVMRTPATRDAALAYLEAQGMLRRGTREAVA